MTSIIKPTGIGHKIFINGKEVAWITGSKANAEAELLKIIIDRHDKMLEALKDIVKRYPNSPWIIDNLQSLINEIESWQ